MKNTTVAFMFDFDDTLIDGSMQEYELFKKLGVSSSKFWAEKDEFAKKNNMDSINAYMYILLEVAKRKNVHITKEMLAKCGRKLPFFNGVKEFFPRLKSYAENLGLNLEFYVISSGNKEIIEGSEIGKSFDRIFASEYVYNKDSEPIWIANNVNYTVKTQFVNRIRKGLLDNLYDSIQVNEKFMDKSSLIPYANMVYFGDGFTDVPCMKVVSMNGGNAICVYTDKNRANAEHTLENGRATHIAPADYTENSRVDKICKNILEEIALKISR